MSLEDLPGMANRFLGICQFDLQVFQALVGAFFIALQLSDGTSELLNIGVTELILESISLFPSYFVQDLRV